MASSSDLEKRANEAFVDDNFELAVDLYTQALHMDPKKPDLFADRAQANIKLNNYTEAVADSNRAIELDPSIPRAYLRKGTACIKLEEYQTAKAALEVGASLAPTDVRFPKLIKECNERMEEEANDQPKVTHIAPTSTKSSSTSVEGSKMLHDQPLLDEVPLCKPKPKYRHEFFQKPEEVVVTVFAKGVSAKNLAVEFGEQILSITIDIPGEEAYHFQPRLFGKIIPEKCRYSLLSTKIEIRLAKAEAIHWTYLEFCKDTVPQKINVSSGISAQKNTYPTSKPKAVDWDKLEAQVKKEEKEEKLNGDAALNKLFRDIYRDADEDTRRAMRKSFVESNGTVLSTNWKEVGKKRVQGSPPDGMEMKKWEY